MRGESPSRQRNREGRALRQGMGEEKLIARVAERKPGRSPSTDILRTSWRRTSENMSENLVAPEHSASVRLMVPVRFVAVVAHFTFRLGAPHDTIVRYAGWIP